MDATPRRERAAVPLLAPLPLAPTAAALHGATPGGAGLDPEALARECLARAEAVDPVLRSLVPESGRLGRVLHEVRRLVARFPAGPHRPRLYGVPVVVKDVLAAENLPTRAGSILPPDLFERPEAAVVRALRNAGGYVLAKGTATEFAILGPAPTRNPHDLERTSGGSSSGPAAAVAAGLAPLSIGTQTVGSIIRPAAYCGVVGFKPTYRRIPTNGLLIGSPSFDTIGLFTQDVAGMQLAAAALLRESTTRPGRTTRTDGPRRLRLGVPDGPQLEHVDPDGAAAFEEACRTLEHEGHALPRVPVLEDLDAIIEHHHTLVAAEFARMHRVWFREYGERYSPAAQGLIERGLAVPTAALHGLRESRTRTLAGLEAARTAHDLDAWVCPAARGVAPRGLASTGDPTPALAWTHAGLPSLSLPFGRSAEGLPFGLQLAGAYDGDEALLDTARVLERVPTRA